MSKEFYRNILGAPFPESEEQRILRELAREYHERTEAYDRTICTGPIIRGRIMPGAALETSAINRHAMQVLEDLKRRLPNGKTISDLHREIHDYRKTR